MKRTVPIWLAVIVWFCGLVWGYYIGYGVGKELIHNEAIAVGAGQWCGSNGSRQFQWVRLGEPCVAICLTDGHGNKVSLCDGGPYASLTGTDSVETPEPPLGPPNAEGAVKWAGATLGQVRKRGFFWWAYPSDALPGLQPACFEREMDATYWLARHYAARQQ